MIERIGKGVLAAVLLVFLASGGLEAASKTGQLVLLTATVPQPVNVSVEPGGVVVWLNGADKQPLSLTFEETKSPDPSCEASLGFARQGSDIITLPALPPGGSASLCFPEAGSYSYKVHGLDRPISGTVTVGGSP